MWITRKPSVYRYPRSFHSHCSYCVQCGGRSTPVHSVNFHKRRPHGWLDNVDLTAHQVQNPAPGGRNMYTCIHTRQPQFNTKFTIRRQDLTLQLVIILVADMSLQKYYVATSILLSRQKRYLWQLTPVIPASNSSPTGIDSAVRALEISMQRDVSSANFFFFFFLSSFKAKPKTVLFSQHFRPC